MWISSLLKWLSLNCHGWYFCVPIPGVSSLSLICVSIVFPISHCFCYCVHIYIFLYMHVCMLSCFSCVSLFVTPRTAAHQALLSMEFSRQECQSGLPFPSPGDCSHPGIKPASPVSPALLAYPLPLRHQESLCIWYIYLYTYIMYMYVNLKITIEIS